MVRLAPHRQQLGFSLIELIVVLALMGVMITMAIPSYTEFVANQRARTQAQTLLGALMYARSEAIKRNATIDIDANAGGWAKGWNITSAADGRIIRKQAEMEGVTITEAAAAVSVSYGGRGRISGANNITFTVCDTRNSADRRLVQIDLSGRPKMTKGDPCQ